MAATRFILGDKHYDYDSSKLGFKEAMELEKVTGLTLGDLETKANAGSVTAVGALIWIAMRRAGETVKWSDFEFDLPSLVTQDLDDDGNVITEPEAADAAPFGATAPST
jgi:hypothetical protein